MNILMLGTDANILKNGSKTAKRMMEYGQLFENLYIFVFSKEKNTKIQLSENVVVYNIQSVNKIKASIKAVRLAKRLPKIDVVSSQDPFELAVIAYRISKKTGSKFHIQVHTDFLNKEYKKLGLRNKVQVLISKFTIPRAYGIRVVSERIKRSLQRTNHNCEITVLPIFVDPEKIEESKIESDLRKEYANYENVILTVSRLSKEKGIDTLLQAFLGVVNFYPKSLLVIVGEGEEKDSLVALAKDLGIYDNVVFKGGSDQVYSYMKSANIYAQASHYEGYGMTFVEAALCRLPIVATRVGIVGDVLKPGQGALVCEVSDKECIAKNLIKLIEDKDLQLQIALEAFKEANRHVLKKEDYLERYKNSYLI